MAGGDRESRYRFELTRLELGGVIVSTAASLFIVFLLGVWAGHGMGDRKLDEAERIVRLPVAPAAAEETPGASDADLTFDDTLGDDEHPARVAGANAAPHGAGDAAAHGAGDTASHPVLPPAVAVPAAEPPRPDTAHAADAAAPAPARTPVARVAVAIAGEPAAPPPSHDGGAWSVQVTATREPRTADDMVKRLRAKGYQAYIVKARREGAMFYRVRVGHFDTMDYASQMVSRLRREPGVPEAFVASD